MVTTTAGKQRVLFSSIGPGPGLLAYAYHRRLKAVVFNRVGHPTDVVRGSFAGSKDAKGTSSLPTDLPVYAEIFFFSR